MLKSPCASGTLILCCVLSPMSKVNNKVVFSAFSLNKMFGVELGCFMNWALKGLMLRPSEFSKA